MYTISMRPDIEHFATHKCVNFEQERATWALATYSELTRTDDGLLGVCFYSPLEKVDISIRQLAAMVAGLDTAYQKLCDAIYAEAPDTLAKTPWQTLDSFMDCIPRGIYESSQDEWMEAQPSDIRPLPFLYHAERGKCLAWTGRTWGLIDPPAYLDTYDTAGVCFGWEVKYKEESMQTDGVQEPALLCRFMARLLESLGCLDSAAKIYTYNLYSVQ